MIEVHNPEWGFKKQEKVRGERVKGTKNLFALYSLETGNFLCNIVAAGEDWNGTDELFIEYEDGSKEPLQVQVDLDDQETAE
jgi:hypothetical protein